MQGVYGVVASVCVVFFYGCVTCRPAERGGGNTILPYRVTFLAPGPPWCVPSNGPFGWFGLIGGKNNLETDLYPVRLNDRGLFFTSRQLSSKYQILLSSRNELIISSFLST